MSDSDMSIDGALRGILCAAHTISCSAARDLLEKRICINICSARYVTESAHRCCYNFANPERRANLSTPIRFCNGISKSKCIQYARKNARPYAYDGVWGIR